MVSEVGQCSGGTAMSESAAVKLNGFKKALDREHLVRRKTVGFAICQYDSSSRVCGIGVCECEDA